MHVVLIVDDDDALRQALVVTIELAGYKCMQAASAVEAIQILDKNQVDLVLTDVSMPDVDGFAFLEKTRKTYPKLALLLMTAYGCVDDAVQAMRAGAVDYILKPFEPEQLLQKISMSLPSKKQAIVTPVVADIKSKELLVLARQAAIKNVSVLISGESGTGKEVLARYIHDNSLRSNKKFIAVNCAAIPENMLEATLFGYEKGAFTGALKNHAGKFEQAQDGTLLLDEISEMDLSLQTKILRVIQEREVERLGSQKTIKLNVRIIATTNRDLKNEVESGTFREDLYYRLNVFPLYWQPLRNRVNDIVPLANFLLEKYVVAEGLQSIKFSIAAQRWLEKYTWPGNVRELDNIIQRAMVVHSGNIIQLEDLQIQLVDLAAIKNNGTHKLADNLQHQEFKVINQVFDELKGDRAKIANRLGISPRTLRNKLSRMREQGYIFS